MFLSMQLGLLRGGEASKAQRRLEELEKDEIGPQLAQGRSVTVTLVMEVPDQVDIAALWAGIGDPGQVVYFKKMYVSDVKAARPVTATDDSHERMDENLAPRTTPVGEPWFVTENRKENQARRGFHLVTRTLSIRPPESSTVPALGGTAGLYRPESCQPRGGNTSGMEIWGMGRMLNIDSMGMIEMWDTREREPYVTQPRGLHHYRFTRGSGKRQYVIDSGIEFLRGSTGTVIAELASGEDLDPQWRRGSTWQAKIAWTRV